MKRVVLRVIFSSSTVTGTEDESQRTLEDSFPATATMLESSRRAKDITNAIGYFVAKDMMTTGFKWLVRVLEPRYVIPHRKTFTDKIIPAMYNSLRDDCVGPLVTSATSFALTADCWTSCATPWYHNPLRHK